MTELTFSAICFMFALLWAAVGDGENDSHKTMCFICLAASIVLFIMAVIT